MKYYTILIFFLAACVLKVDSRPKFCQRTGKPVDMDSPDCSLQIMNDRPGYWLNCCFKPIVRRNRWLKKHHKVIESPTTTTEDSSSPSTPSYSSVDQQIPEISTDP